MNPSDIECCVECGGYEGLDTCICENFPEPESKQICHFCGVDLFLYKTDTKILTCLSCATELDHNDCINCVRCNKTWLVDGAGSVCALCKLL